MDLIDALVSTGAIKDEERLEYRTRLRRAGYFFVPVSEDELAHHLDVSAVENGKVVETAELKAIRENILHVRMNTWLQLPKESPWLGTLLQVFSRVLTDLWRADVDVTSARARSDWILNQMDVRSWAHSLGKEDGDNMVKTGRGTNILSMLVPPIKEPQEVKDEYWRWVDEKVLAPLKEQNPDLYLDLVERYQRQIADVVGKYMNGEQ